jgi:hypothetical protein
MGTIQVKRAYYYSSEAKKGCIPWDQVLGIGPHRVTPAVEQMATTFYVKHAAAEAVDSLKLAGVRLAERTVDRIAGDCGQTLIDAEEAGEVFGSDLPWQWQSDATGQRVGYVSLDATSVRQQAEGGQAAPSRMANVLRIYSSSSSETTEQGCQDSGTARYVAAIGNLDEVCAQGQQIGKQLGAHQVQQWVGISDGGSGLENRMRLMFGGRSTVCILDFWHAKEYLVELAQTVFESESDRSHWLDAVCHQLKHEGGGAVLKRLESMQIPPPASEKYTETLRYYRNHEHQMKYPEYREHGWSIGSGAIESACKHVVKSRLNGAGMRWSEEGSDRLCRLRALYRSQSGCWSAFWEFCRPQAA